MALLVDRVATLLAVESLPSPLRFRGQKREGSLALHLLRIKGVAEAGALAGPTGLGSGALEALLAELAASGLVEHRQGALPGWRPTASGVEHDDAWLAAELAGAGARARVGEAYRSFLVLNPEVLEACTAWQLVAGDTTSPVVNDHTDEAYDATVVARLADIHRRARVVLGDLEAYLPRFGRYHLRLQGALDRVKGGDGDWFTRPLLDSYHQVWFELHQDLLFTLSLDRADEADGARRG